MRLYSPRLRIGVALSLIFSALAAGAIAQTSANPPDGKETAPTAAQLRTLANLRLLQQAVKLGALFTAALDETEPPGETPDAKANRAMDALLKASGLTIADLNQARARTAANAAKPDSSPLSLETIVLMSIAERAFQRKDAALITAAEKRGIDFSQSEFAALRARQTGQPPLEVARLLTDAVIAAPSLIKENRLTEGTDDFLVSRIAGCIKREADRRFMDRNFRTRRERRDFPSRAGLL